MKPDRVLVVDDERAQRDALRQYLTRKGYEVDAVAWRSARLSAKRLGEDSDIIRGAVEKEGARIVTAFYHLETGEVEFE